MERINNLAAGHRLARHRLRMLGEVCPSCKEIMVYSRDVCPGCKNTTVDDKGKALITIELDQTKKGETIYQAPDTPDPGPRDQVLG